jgi:hypothetical protein
LQYFAAHRPRLVLKDIHLEKRQIFYILTNVGDTKATIVEGWIQVESWVNDAPLRPLRSAGHFDLKGCVFDGGEIKDLTYDLPAQFAFSSGSIIIKDEYFAGTIIYEDELGIKRRSVFRRRWNLAFIIENTDSTLLRLW